MVSNDAIRDRFLREGIYAAGSKAYVLQWSLVSYPEFLTDLAIYGRATAMDS